MGILDIVIPSFNQQEFLPDAIESALGQHGVSQIIVVDDGSTDNSLEIARKYEHQGATVISQVNKGLASARNTGIMNSKSDYVLFLDADDILLEGCVEKIIEIAASTQADMIAPSFKEFGISNHPIILMENPKLKDFRDGNRVGYCQAIKRSVLLEVGGYNPKMTWGYEDLALTCLLLSKGYKLVTIPEILWLYRTKEKSMIHEAQNHHQELLNIINKDVPEAQLKF